MRQSSRFGLLATLLIVGACNDLPTTLVPVPGGALAARATSSITATATSATTVTVEWVDVSTMENGWELYRAETPSGSPVLIATLAANTTSYADDSLRPLTAYCYRVRYFRVAGKNKFFGPFSPAACATTQAPPRPPAPTNVHAKPNGAFNVLVTWTDNSPWPSYYVERGPGVDGPWGLSATVSGTKEFTEYMPVELLFCFRVKTNSNGQTSDPSAVFCTAAPTPATSLAAVVGTAGTVGTNQVVDLTWTDNSSLEDGYEIYRSEPVTSSGSTLVGVVAGNVTAFRDTLVLPDRTYAYVVAATRDGGRTMNSGAAVAVTVANPPPAPAITVWPGGLNVVHLYWDLVARTESFRIERSSDHGGTWTQAGVTVGGTQQFFTDVTMPEATTERELCYRVFSVNSKGEALSNVACVTPPFAPTNLVAARSGQGGVVLTWTDNSNIEEGYRVYFTNADGYPDMVELPPNATSFEDGAAISGWHDYWVEARKDGGGSSANVGIDLGSCLFCEAVRAQQRRAPVGPALKAPTGRRGLPEQKPSAANRRTP